MKAGIVALALVIAGPAAAYQDVDGSAGKLPADARAKLADKLDGLYDPDAAKIRKLKLTGKGQVCVLINGKNLMGAYTGYRYFYFGGDDDLLRIAEVPEAPPIQAYNATPAAGQCED